MLIFKRRLFLTSSRRQSGSALLNAIIVAGIVAGIAGILLSQTKTTDKMSRNPRIKSAMTVLETQMLSMALQPGIYQGCSAQAQNCQLNSNAVAAFQHLAHNIVGANCGNSSQGAKPGSGGTSSLPCGVKVQAASSMACLSTKNPGYNSNCAAGQFYNPATQTFCAEIVYQGTELAMQPVCASTTVPQSVLQGDSTSCTSATNLAGPYPKIIFRGYDSAGNAVCSPIPSCSGGNISSQGNYITAIDKVSMQTQCKTLNPILSCPPGTVMTNLKWYNVSSAFGTLSPSANCVPRRLPADAHQVQAATPITVPPGTYAVPTTLPSGVPLYARYSFGHPVVDSVLIPYQAKGMPMSGNAMVMLQFSSSGWTLTGNCRNPLSPTCSSEKTILSGPLQTGAMAVRFATTLRPDLAGSGYRVDAGAVAYNGASSITPVSSNPFVTLTTSSISSNDGNGYDMVMQVEVIQYDAGGNVLSDVTIYFEAEAVGTA